MVVVIKTTETIGNFSGSERYLAHMQRVRKAVDQESKIDISSKGTLEDDPEYRLVISCNEILQDLDAETVATQNFVATIYAKKFPELESLIPNKIDYINAVKKIGNEMDLTVVDLSSILSSSLVMIVSVSASTTTGSPLSPEELHECYRGCDEVLKLTEDKATILRFIEQRMIRIAPNLCALVGASVTAQLVGLAGGLVALSKIPSCNIQVIGQERRNLAGLSFTSTMPHAGYLSNCDIVKKTPPFLRKKALKVTAGKVALAARIDSYQNTFDSTQGQTMRTEIEEKFAKLEEPQKARTKKALPVPEEKKFSRRGGKRVRKMKERFALTDVRKQQNKMAFTTDEGEYGDSAMGFDQGMVGSKDTGRLRAPVKKDQSHLLKKQKKAISVSSGQTNGLSSSLVFTPVQGLELVNPDAAAQRVKEANQKWFNSQAGFASAAPK